VSPGGAAEVDRKTALNFAVHRGRYWHVSTALGAAFDVGVAPISGRSANAGFW